MSSTLQTTPGLAPNARAARETRSGEISVNEKIRNALIHHKGEMYDVLQLIYAYEREDK